MLHGGDGIRAVSFSRILTQRNRRWRTSAASAPNAVFATPSGTRLTFTFTPSVTD
ncbi:hypothetical protein EC2756500_5365 [Escherichia coli 2756500]|nr:hypothetical protein EC2756500_5365 [Escherichia coli 2756500]